MSLYLAQDESYIVFYCLFRVVSSSFKLMSYSPKVDLVDSEQICLLAVSTKKQDSFHVLVSDMFCIVASFTRRISFLVDDIRPLLSSSRYVCTVNGSQ